jgi:hypothetical protein
MRSEAGFTTSAPVPDPLAGEPLEGFGVGSAGVETVGSDGALVTSLATASTVEPTEVGCGVVSTLGAELPLPLDVGVVVPFEPGPPLVGLEDGLFGSGSAPVTASVAGLVGALCGSGAEVPELGLEVEPEEDLGAESDEDVGAEFVDGFGAEDPLEGAVTWGAFTSGVVTSTGPTPSALAAGG